MLRIGNTGSRAKGARRIFGDLGTSNAPKKVDSLRYPKSEKHRKTGIMSRLEKKQVYKKQVTRNLLFILCH